MWWRLCENAITQSHHRTIANTLSYYRIASLWIITYNHDGPNGSQWWGANGNIYMHVIFLKAYITAKHTHYYGIRFALTLIYTIYFLFLYTVVNHCKTIQVKYVINATRKKYVHSLPKTIDHLFPQKKFLFNKNAYRICLYAFIFS